MGIRWAFIAVLFSLLTFSSQSYAASSIQEVFGQVGNSLFGGPLGGIKIRITNNATAASALTTAANGSYVLRKQIPKEYEYYDPYCYTGYDSWGSLVYYGCYRTESNSLTIAASAPNFYPESVTYNIDAHPNVVNQTFDLETIVVPSRSRGACKRDDENFVSVNGGCHDMETGLTWGPISPTRINFHRANKIYCDQNQGLRLPTVPELRHITRVQGIHTYFNFNTNLGFWSGNFANEAKGLVWAVNLFNNDLNSTSGLNGFFAACIIN